MRGSQPGGNARRVPTCARRALQIAWFGLAVALAAGAPDALGERTTRTGKLPPGTLHGPARLLYQYPTLSLATPAQRSAAERLLGEIRTATRPWRDARAAVSAGFATGERRRRPSDRSVRYLHAEHRGFRNDGRYLVPDRPETLVYADVAGKPLVLIGVMFGVPRAVHGPTPGGPITRWHTHRVCVRGRQRGLTPGRDGSCPPGSRALQGSEMMHVWFTRDLRSAYAIHAPVPELCVARLLPPRHCHGGHGHR
jgi:hypothetical protein